MISPLSADESWHKIRRYDVTDAGLSVLSQEWDAYPGARERIGPRSSLGMLGGWVMFLIKWIVRLYPKAWRERYEDEMIELLGTHEITLWTWLDLLWNALDARLDPFYRRSAPLSPFRRLRRVQWAMLAAFILPLLSALSYVFFFSLGGLPFIGGLREDYWRRNEHYPILALTHGLGSIALTATWLCALLTLIVFAYGGIKKFGRPGEALVHRLILVAMFLPFALSILASFLPDSLREVGNTVFGNDTLVFGSNALVFVGSFLLISLLLAGWCWLRREAFTRALPYLLPWLGFNLFALLLGSGLLLPPASENTSEFYQLIALLCLLSTPFSFVVALIRLRLGKQLRSSLLILATVATLSMTLVQLMMAMRLITLHLLNLDMIWSTELIVALIINVLCTALALVFVLTFLLKRRRRTLPPLTSSQVLVLPSPKQG